MKLPLMEIVDDNGDDSLPLARITTSEMDPSPADHYHLANGVPWVPPEHRLDVLVFDAQNYLMEELCVWRVTVPEAVMMLTRLANTVFQCGPDAAKLIDETGVPAASLEIERSNDAP